MQVFRTASMMLFDSQLVLLGPSAYVILLDKLVRPIYPVCLGLSGIGKPFAPEFVIRIFRRTDLP